MTSSAAFGATSGTCSGVAEGLDVETSGMSDERIRLVAAQADHEELKVAEMQAALLPRDGVLDAWQQLRAASSARCLAIPPLLSARLAVIQDRAEVQAILTAAVREALTECSRFDLPDPRVASPPPAVTVSPDRGEHGQYQLIRPPHLGGYMQSTGTLSCTCCSRL